jgi:hypothetical protein
MVCFYFNVVFLHIFTINFVGREQRRDPQSTKTEYFASSVADPGPDLFGRIRTSGTGSGRLGPDPDPGPNK